MNTNKNAYEIRLEILSIARNDLMELFLQKLQNARVKTNGENGERWSRSEEKLDEKVISHLLPTSEDIIKRAKELYAFVENA